MHLSTATLLIITTITWAQEQHHEPLIGPQSDLPLQVYQNSALQLITMVKLNANFVRVDRNLNFQQWTKALSTLENIKLSQSDICNEYDRIYSGIIDHNNAYTIVLDEYNPLNAKYACSSRGLQLPEVRSQADKERLSHFMSTKNISQVVAGIYSSRSADALFRSDDSFARDSIFSALCDSYRPGEQYEFTPDHLPKTWQEAESLKSFQSYYYYQRNVNISKVAKLELCTEFSMDKPISGKNATIICQRPSKHNDKINLHQTKEHSYRTTANTCHEKVSNMDLDIRTLELRIKLFREATPDIEEIKNTYEDILLEQLQQGEDRVQNASDLYATETISVVPAHQRPKRTPTDNSTISTSDFTLLRSTLPFMISQTILLAFLNATLPRHRRDTTSTTSIDTVAISQWVNDYMNSPLYNDHLSQLHSHGQLNETILANFIQEYRNSINDTDLNTPLANKFLTASPLTKLSNTPFDQSNPLPQNLRTATLNPKFTAMSNMEQLFFRYLQKGVSLSSEPVHEDFIRAKSQCSETIDPQSVIYNLEKLICISNALKDSPDRLSILSDLTDHIIVSTIQNIHKHGTKEERSILASLGVLGGAFLVDVSLRIMSNMIHHNKMAELRRISNKHTLQISDLHIGQNKIVHSLARTNSYIINLNNKLNNMEFQLNLVRAETMLQSEFQSTVNLLSADVFSTSYGVYLAEMGKIVPDILSRTDAMYIKQKFWLEKKLSLDSNLESLKIFVRRENQDIGLSYGFPIENDLRQAILYRVHPLASFKGQKKYLPRIQTNYVAISSHENSYAFLNEGEAYKCLEKPAHCLITSHLVKATRSICGLSSFFQISENCQYTQDYTDAAMAQFITVANQTVYSLPSPMKIATFCPQELTAGSEMTQTISGRGSLLTRSGCYNKANDFIILPTNNALYSNVPKDEHFELMKPAILFQHNISSLLNQDISNNLLLGDDLSEQIQSEIASLKDMLNSPMDTDTQSPIENDYVFYGIISASAIVGLLCFIIIIALMIKCAMCCGWTSTISPPSTPKLPARRKQTQLPHHSFSSNDKQYINQESSHTYTHALDIDFTQPTYDTASATINGAQSEHDLVTNQ